MIKTGRAGSKGGGGGDRLRVAAPAPHSVQRKCRRYKATGQRQPLASAGERGCGWGRKTRSPARGCAACADSSPADTALGLCLRTNCKYVRAPHCEAHQRPEYSTVIGCVRGRTRSLALRFPVLYTRRPAQTCGSRPSSHPQVSRRRECRRRGCPFVLSFDAA